MITRKLSVFASLAVMLIGDHAALAQFNLPREIPQVLDALKGRGEQQKPAAPTQVPPAARENEPGSAFRTQGQPKAQDTPESAATKALLNNEHYSTFRNWAQGTQLPRAVPNEFKFCIVAYDKMIASGISPQTRVPEQRITGFHSPTSQNYDFMYSGTVQEIKENWCEAGLNKITGDVAARHAPYRAALRNDKLNMMIDETHGHVRSYALAGGQYTDDAKRLAVAPVWFLDVGAPSNEAQNCLSGGKRNTVRRYTFDAQHNRTGTTERHYCGNPPASAYQ